MSRAENPAWMATTAWLGAWLLRGWGATWRIERIAIAEPEAGLAAGERCIFAFWHARLLPLVYTHRGRGIAVMISQHRDGERIAGVVERLGYRTARGSSTRGGDEALRDMLSFAEAGRLLAVSPDGPRGPAEQVKPGLIYLASRTGFPVIPVSAATRQGSRLRSWDRFLVPWPLARLVTGYGPAIAVPPRIDEAQIEIWRVRVQDALVNLTRDLERRAGVGA